MWPTLFKIGNFEIGTFGLMVAIGFFAGYTVAVNRAAKKGFPEEQVSNLLILSLIAAVFGAKILHVIVNFGNGTFTDLLFSRRGLVFYGGLIGGVGMGWFLVLRKGWDAADFADCVAPSIPLGLFFGRIGCFLNGCCFGRVCDSPLGVRFPRIEEGGGLIGSEPYIHQWVQGMLEQDSRWSLPVHATQIYASLAGLVTFLVLQFWVSGRTWFRGQLALIFLLMYSGGRFVEEIFRDDPRGFFPGGLSTSQGISVGLAVFALALWPILRKRPIEPGPSPAASEPGEHSH